MDSDRGFRQQGYRSMVLECREAIALKQKIEQLLDKHRHWHVERVKLLAVATIVDPRFKKLYFESPLTATSAATWVAELVKEEISKSLQKFVEILSTMSDDQPADSENDLWSIHDRLVAEKSQSSVNENSGGLPVQLPQYLQSSVASRTSDPFVVWDVLKEQYPHVYRIAFMYISAIREVLL